MNVPARVSAVVIAQDCADQIPRCLASLAFADEILVIDGGSVDDTAAVARAWGARVLVNAWPGFAAQRRFALEHAAHAWVLVVDTDEEVSPELAREIPSALAAAARDGAPVAFRIRRRSRFLGGWMDAGPWARDLKLRLARRDALRVTDARVHEGYVADGPVGDLVSVLFHHTHATISESVRRLNRYTSLEARDRAGRRRIGVTDAVIAPAGVFFRYYVVRGCWRAGLRGFLLAAITAMYKSVLYMKIRSLQQENGGEGHA